MSASVSKIWRRRNGGIDSAKISARKLAAVSAMKMAAEMAVSQPGS